MWSHNREYKKSVWIIIIMIGTLTLLGHMNDIVATMSLRAGRLQGKTSTVCIAYLKEVSATVFLACLVHSRCNSSKNAYY